MGKGACRVKWGYRVERENLKDLRVDGRIILKTCLKIGWEDVDLIDWVEDSRELAGSCERGTELPGCTKCGEFHKQLRNRQLFQKNLLHEVFHKM
jgi:hypothetical protein